MQEMLFVGRGGEGVVLASQLLADAFSRAGYWAQSFPEFKAERRGAPISAFLRWDETSPIHRRYRVRECDVLVGISPSPPPAHLLADIRPGGLLILNAEERLPLQRPLRDRPRPGRPDRARRRDPLLGGPADGQRRRARRLRQASAPRRTSLSGAGDRGAYGLGRRAQRPRRTGGLRPLRAAAHATPAIPSSRGCRPGLPVRRTRTRCSPSAPPTRSRTTRAPGRSTGP